ncbi:protease insulinase family [Photobacterium aphoticum]|uniref:Protease insulinase family n=1 Tax=Photobacterium aphoticum TaxID=754436 RepID=A0A090QZT3_9GAMM|nr:protease insulinase family [Photobacterium aphoticum]
MAQLTASMMQEATQTSTAEALSSKLDTLGSSVSFSAGQYGTVISVASLTKNLPETLAIMEEMLFKPGFHQADFERLKKQALEGIIYEHQNPSWLASQASREVLFGGTTFSLPPEGTKASLAAITLEDVKAFYHRYYTPNGADMVVIGDVDQATLSPQLSALATWQGMPAPTYTTPALPTLPKQTVWMVDKPGAPQTVIRLVRQGMPYDATGELYETQLANFNLAGNFNSRINLNLREDKGYTYGAGGYQSGGKEVGLSTYYAQVRADASVASVQEFLTELNKMATEGVTDKELDFMRLAVGQKDALNYETPSKKAQLLGRS